MGFNFEYDEREFVYRCKKCENTYTTTLQIAERMCPVCNEGANKKRQLREKALRKKALAKLTKAERRALGV